MRTPGLRRVRPVWRLHRNFLSIGVKSMISSELVIQIRSLFHAEHWKIGTIAAELGLHAETVRNALETDRFNG
jgi:hypothetical protein